MSFSVSQFRQRAAIPAPLDPLLPLLPLHVHATPSLTLGRRVPQLIPRACTNVQRPLASVPTFAAGGALASSVLPLSHIAPPTIAIDSPCALFQLRCCPSCPYMEFSSHSFFKVSKLSSICDHPQCSARSLFVCADSTSCI